MTDREHPSIGALRVLRWVARGWSLAVFAFVAVIVVGEGLASGAQDLSSDVLVDPLLYLFGGMLLGLALAWRWEGVGGALNVASYLGFELVRQAASRGQPGFVPFLALFAGPGVLFVISWLLTRPSARRPADTL